MNRFAYSAYYEYSGPTGSDPLRSPKDEDEVDFALRRFPEELPYYLSDKDAVVSSVPETDGQKTITIVVVTSLDEISVDQAVKKCLNGLDLFGRKLNRPLD